MDEFRVLVVEDGMEPMMWAASCLDRGAELLPAPPHVIQAGSFTEAAAAINDCAQSGTAIDAAIVDLGLGARQPSGLGVIDLLDKAGVPVAVWTDWAEGAKRLMFVYAAFTWYSPVALLPKAKFRATADGERVARDFARNIARIHQRQAPASELATYFRPRRSRDWPFTEVLSSQADLRKWRAFLVHNQTAAVATHLGLRPRRIDNWLVEKYEPVWRLLQHAAKYMDITGVEIPEPPDRLAPRPAGEKKTYVDRKAALLQFARSQSLFFNDPVVIARYPER